jgi:hypothetical protein
LEALALLDELQAGTRRTVEIWNVAQRIQYDEIESPQLSEEDGMHDLPED